MQHRFYILNKLNNVNRMNISNFLYIWKLNKSELDHLDPSDVSFRLRSALQLIKILRNSLSFYRIPPHPTIQTATLEALPC